MAGGRGVIHLEVADTGTINDARRRVGEGSIERSERGVDPPSTPFVKNPRVYPGKHAAYSTVTLTFTLRSEAEKQDNVDVCEVEAIALAAGVPDVSYNAPLFGIVSYHLCRESRSDSAILYEHDIALHNTQREEECNYVRK